MTTDVAATCGNPPAEAWLAMKPIFLDLYLRQDKSLDEVRRHLQSRYSFAASTKAYKLRVKQWSAFKYRKRQKPRLPMIAKQGLSSVSRDHIVEERVGNSHSSQILGLAENVIARGFRPREFTNSMVRMDQHIQDTSVHLCSATHEFWQWTIRSTSSPRTDHVWSSHLAPSWALIDAVTLLSMPARHKQGQIKLLQVQDAISSSIQRTPAATLLAIVGLFTFEKWHPYPGVQNVLFSYIREYACRCLPTDHPFRRILEHTNSDDMRQVAGQLFVVQVDTLMRIQKAGGDVPDWFFFAPTLGLIQARLLNDAQRISMHRLARAETKLQRCRILSMLVRCHFYSRDFDGSIGTGVLILNLITELLAEGEYVWPDLVNIADLLAKSYAEKGQWDKTIEYYWLAFKNGLEQYGQSATNVKYYCYELERSLTEHGNAEELASLRSEYSFMFSSHSTGGGRPDGNKTAVNNVHLQASSTDIEVALKALIAF